MLLLGTILSNTLAVADSATPDVEVVDDFRDGASTDEAVKSTPGCRFKCCPLISSDVEELSCMTSIDSSFLEDAVSANDITKCCCHDLSDFGAWPYTIDVDHSNPDLVGSEQAVAPYDPSLASTMHAPQHEENMIALSCKFDCSWKEFGAFLCRRSDEDQAPPLLAGSSV